MFIEGFSIFGQHDESARGELEAFREGEPDSFADLHAAQVQSLCPGIFQFEELGAAPEWVIHHLGDQQFLQRTFNNELGFGQGAPFILVFNPGFNPGGALNGERLVVSICGFGQGTAFQPRITSVQREVNYPLGCLKC